MRNILMITTGGTIASAQTPCGLIPKLNSDELLSYLPPIQGDIHVDTRELYSIDSTNATPDHWQLIAECIEKEYDAYDGFVVCHGTDTMAYAAATLSYLIQDSPKPIVLTGAQKPIGMIITDAKTNLRDSIIYAADEKSQGVQVVFNGKVIMGTRAKKTRTFSFEAFSSINYPYIADMYDGQIIRYITQSKDGLAVKFNRELNKNVFLLKLVPGMSDDIIPLVFEHYDGIIIEGFGTGGIPNSIQDTLFSSLDKYSAEEKVLVMATQVQLEGSNMSVYEVGTKLKSKYKILEAGDMTIEAIYAKLMWVLAKENQTWDEIEARFKAVVSKDRVRK